MNCLSPDSSKEQRNSLELPPDSSEEQRNCLELPPDSSEEQGICLELPPDSSEEPDSTEEVRNWLELPPDVMCLIFEKLGAIEILYSAQSVCSTWRKLSKEPQLWRSVDMRKRRDSLFGDEYIMEKMARESVDRSCGQLVEFSVEHFGTDELLQYMADRTT
ncbi:F-box domain [Macleaya cordata]|uniref:F-box domain n=1 Tax=Macleaya cordata TaxID=56857 RepID=A0A200QS07_MACCD|nr:F-box domain [Macleaya cordata]